MAVGLLARFSLLASTFLGVYALYTPTACNETSGAAEGICTRSVVDIMATDFAHLFEREFIDESGRPVNSTMEAREITPRVVYSPKITSPTSNTVWVAGTSATVTWYVSLPLD